MLANGAEFAGNAAPRPQQLDPVPRTAFRTNALGGLFAETNGLNAFDSHFGVEISFFCFHFHLSIKKLGEGKAGSPSAGHGTEKQDRAADRTVRMIDMGVMSDGLESFRVAQQ